MATQFGPLSLQTVRVAGEETDVVALSGEFLSRGTTDTSPSSRHDNYLRHAITPRTVNFCDRRNRYASHAVIE